MTATKSGATKTRGVKRGSATKAGVTVTSEPGADDDVIKVIFASAGYELLEMDPHKLYLGEGIESNTRTDVERDDDFFRSVAKKGVDLVIEARRDEQNRVKVHDGKRRTLAAREGGVKSVLVLVKPTNISDKRSAEVARIFSQLRINELQRDITYKDKILALQQLVLLDVTPEELADERNIELKDAQKIVTTVRSKAAVQAADYDLTIDEMAIFAEFDGDDEAIEDLRTIAQNHRGNLDYKAREWRSKRADAVLLQEAKAKHAGSNVTVIAERDDSYDDDKTKTLEQLRPSAGHEPGTELTTAAHKKCPGHALLVSLDGFGKTRKAVVEPVCTDYRLYGHARRDTPIGVVEPPKPDSKMTQQQLADLNAARVNNPKWRDATAPRIGWTSEFLLAGVLPPGFKYHRRLAQLQATAAYEFNRARERGHTTLCQMLRITLKPTVYGKLGGDLDALQKLCAGASEQRAKMINLGMWLFAIEENLGKDAWRRKTPEAVLLLTTLEELGKPLQEIELKLLGRDKNTTAGNSAPPSPDDAPKPVTTPEPATDPVAPQEVAAVEQAPTSDDLATSPEAVTPHPAEEPAPTEVTAADSDSPIAA